MRASYLDFRARLKAPTADNSPEQYVTVQGEMHVARFGESNDAYRSLRGKEVVGLEYHDPKLLECLIEGLISLTIAITPAFLSNTYYRLFERRAEPVNQRINNEDMDLLLYESVNSFFDSAIRFGGIEGDPGLDKADWHAITLMERRSWYLPTLREFAINHAASSGGTNLYPDKTVKDPEESALSVKLYQAVFAYHGGNPDSLEPLRVRKVVNIEEKPPWLMTLATYAAGLAMAGALMSFSPTRELLRGVVRKYFGKTKYLRFNNFLDSLPDHLATRATNPISWPRLIRQRNRSFSQWVATPKSQLCGSLVTLGELYIGLCIFSVIHTDYLTVTLRNQRMAEATVKMIQQNGAQENLILVGAMHMGIVDLLIEKYGYEIVGETSKND